MPSIGAPDEQGQQQQQQQQPQQRQRPGTALEEPTTPAIEALPTADLPVLSFAKLARDDPDERRQLLAACASNGCFYLDVSLVDSGGAASSLTTTNGRGAESGGDDDGNDNDNDNDDDDDDDDGGAPASGRKYLSNDHRQGSRLATLVDSMYDTVDEVFDLELDEKMKYDTDVIDDLKRAGYKPLGRNAGGLPGKKDAFETFAIATDDLFGHRDRLPKAGYPYPIQSKWSNLVEFSTLIDRVNYHLLRNLSESLGLRKRRLEDIHCPLSSACPSMIRLLRYEPGVPAGPASTAAAAAASSKSTCTSKSSSTSTSTSTSSPAGPDAIERAFPHIAHTDTGSTTILFSRRPGLQIFNRLTQRWEAVAPDPPRLANTARKHDSDGGKDDGEDDCRRMRALCAIVNLGDGMSLLTDGRLHAPLHRVVIPPTTTSSSAAADADAAAVPQEPRRSFGFFLRAGADTKMAGEDAAHAESVLTSAEWLAQKFRALRMKTNGADNAWKIAGFREDSTVDVANGMSPRA